MGLKMIKMEYCNLQKYTKLSLNNTIFYQYDINGRLPYIYNIVYVYVNKLMIS